MRDTVEREGARTDAAGNAWLSWLPLVLGAVLALSYLTWARVHVLILLDHAALGRETVFYSDGKGSRVEQTQCTGATDSPECIKSWEAAGRPPVILWFGNSQLMGINRSKPGDLNAPAQLGQLANARGYRVVTYAQPNSNLSEETIIFDAVAPVLKPKLFILPVCYDDIRELEIRDDIAAFRPGEKLQADPDAAKPAEPGKVATSQTVQARAEAAVTGELSKYWPLWEDRPKLRGTLGFAIHALRNKALGIHSNSKRPVDPGVYRDRMQLLERMVSRARAMGMDVLLYVPPYRWDIPGPYVEADYLKFKADMKAIAERHGARFADIDAIVPGPEWAMVVDDLFGFEEPDFMHFTVTGHKRLTAAVDAQIRAMGY